MVSKFDRHMRGHVHFVATVSMRRLPGARGPRRRDRHSDRRRGAPCRVTLARLHLAWATTHGLGRKPASAHSAGRPKSGGSKTVAFF